MAVAYEEARDRVRQATEPGWSHGTYCLDDRKIVETDEYFAFEIGAREFLVDGDEEYEAIGGLTVVFKESGEVGALSSVEVNTDPRLQIRPNPNPTFQID